MFEVPLPLTPFHIGQSEVDHLLDQREPKFCEPMLFDRGSGTVQDNTFDPTQVWGVTSVMPKLSVPAALKEVRSPESGALGLASVYEYKRLVAYLRVNSRDKDRPLMPFRVSGHFYWSFLIELVISTHFELVNSKDLATFPYLGSLLLTKQCGWSFLKKVVVCAGRKSV